MSGLRIVPLLGWYDYSFGVLSEHLHSIWMDYRTCRWSFGWGPADAAAWLYGCNRPELPSSGEVLITFSRFLARIDLMAVNAPRQVKSLHPILGGAWIDAEVRWLGAAVHVCGHSRLDATSTRDGIHYVNNGFGYPHDASITRKHLVCSYEEA